MNRVAAALVAGAIALLLAGCAAPATTAAPHHAEASTPAPLVATHAPSTPPTDPTAAYLAHLRDRIEANHLSEIAGATDDQLVAAGHEACDQLAAGTDYFDVRVVQDETPDFGGYYAGSLLITGAATMFFCTDYLQG